MSLSHHIHQYTNEPYKHTHRSAPLTTLGVGVSTRLIACATGLHASCPPLLLSHSHLCLAVGHKVGLCGEEVLAVAVASGAVELVGLQDGTLRPLVPVGLPPAHRLSPIPALQTQPHSVPSRDCVGTVRQWAAHCSRAGADDGLGGPGDAQGRATWHCPRHVCKGGSPVSWRLATVAVTMSVRAVRAVRGVGNVTVAALVFVPIWLESTSYSTYSPTSSSSSATG